MRDKEVEERQGEQKDDAEVDSKPPEVTEAADEAESSGLGVGNRREQRWTVQIRWGKLGI